MVLVPISLENHDAIGARRRAHHPSHPAYWIQPDWTN